MNCISIRSDNILLLIQRHAIIYTNAGLLSIGTLGTNSSEIITKVQAFHSQKCFWNHYLRGLGVGVCVCVCVRVCVCVWGGGG